VTETRGRLIAFEGIDGAGKTTQARRLAATLRADGLEVIETKEPTNGPIGQRIRASAQTGRLPIDEELALFVADRREHVATLIRPALARGAWVLVDRYYPSTVAYQGARGKDPAELLALNESFAPRPDLLLIFDIDPRIGLARVRARGDVADLFEQVDQLAAARAVFATLSGDHVRTVDASADVDAVEGQIRGWVSALRT
jgi:dTMP kinase